MRTIYHYLTVGFEIAVALAAPMAAGFWLDQRMDSSPWFLLIGAVLGIILFIRIAVRLSQNWTSSTPGKSSSNRYQKQSNSKGD